MQVHPQLLSCISNDTTKTMNESAHQMIKELTKTIKAGRSTRVEGSLIYEIVPTAYTLPRSCSEDKIKTKWEKFAEEKGIQKKKKSRMVYSEKAEKWMPRYGSRSEQNLILQGGVVEVEQSMSKMINEKKKRIAKNKKNEENNKKRAKETKQAEINAKSTEFQNKKKIKKNK